MTTWELAHAILEFASSDKARARVAKTVAQLAEQNMEIWTRAGPWAQIEVAKLLPSALETRAQHPLVVAAAGAMLSSEVRGTTGGFDTITFHQGAVSPSEQLASSRNTAMEALETLLFDPAAPARDAAFTAILKATSYPNVAGYKLELAGLIEENCLRVVRIAERLAPTVELAFRARIEASLFQIYRREVGALHDGHVETGPEAEAAKLRALREEVAAALKGLAASLNADTDFTNYKTLVGFNNVSLGDWERGTLDLRVQRDEREAAVQRLATALTLEAFDDITRQILVAVSTRSSDGATFTWLRKFFETVGREQPDFALRLIAEHEDMLSSRLGSILNGLKVSGRQADRTKFLNRWIDERCHLDQVLETTSRSADDRDLFIRVAEAIISGSDERAVLQLVDDATRAAEDWPEVIGRLLVPAIGRAAKAHPSDWTHYTWFAWDGEFVDRFTEAEIDTVLDVMAPIPRIRTNEDWILAAIARPYPAKIFEFFDRRFALEQHVGAEIEALPEDLHQLAPQLAAHPEATIAHLRAWYPSDHNLFTYSGGKFLKGVFGDLSPVVALLMPFAEGTDEDRDFLVKVLRAYEGSPTIDELARALVANSTSGSDIWTSVSMALDETGVVGGEFGFVEAYEERKTRLQAWLDDPRPLVQQFAEGYLRSLDRQIAAERRRSVETFNLRKRQYGTESS